MTRMIQFCAVITAFVTLAAGAPAQGAAKKDVLSQIEIMAAKGEKATDSLLESVIAGIAANPSKVSKALIPKLNRKNLKEQRLAVYLWALGQTGDEKAIPPLEALYQRTPSRSVRTGCLLAISTIGGPKAEEILLSALDNTKGEDERFEILNLLAQMQCEAVLPKTEEILKLDPSFYWKSVFVFGKMGDKAVPFLLKKLNDEDANTRNNAVNVLGQWLAAPEAAKPLQEMFWKENDEELKSMILSGVERTFDDLDEMKAFFEQVEKKETNGENVRFALEFLRNADKIKSRVKEWAGKKNPSPAFFQRVYDPLFKSAGMEGSYDDLDLASAIQDEPKLKALRERILQRGDEETLKDYRRVNKIISQNRIIARMMENK